MEQWQIKPALVKSLAATDEFDLPEGWRCAVIKTDGGDCTITDSFGESIVLTDGDEINYGKVDSLTGFSSWNILAGAGATVLIAYNI